MRRRSSIGPSTFRMDDDNDFEQSALGLSEGSQSQGSQPMERHNSRLSDVSFTMDRTSFADPDRLTVLMGEPEGLKQELSLQIIESFPFDSNNTTPDVFVVNASHKLDVLCLHEHRSQLLHLYHISRHASCIPSFKEKSRIPALSAAPICIHTSQRLLILSPDLILRIHAPWHTRLNIVFPSTRPWRLISQINGNRFTLTDTKSQSERYHLGLVPQNRLIAWCLDVFECLLDSSFYSLFLSVYGTARLKAKASDISAFVNTLFACFLAFNDRTPSPSPNPMPDAKSEQDPWEKVRSILECKTRSDPTQRSQNFSPLSYVSQAREFVHHFEGVQRTNHLTVILWALHALSEELRIHIGMSDSNRILVPILCQLAYWLSRPAFVEFYMSSDVHFETIEFDKRSFSNIRHVGLSQQEPWSIYKWLIRCIHAGVSRVQQDELVTLDVLLFKTSDKTPAADKIAQARSLLPSIDKLLNIYPLLNLHDFRSALIGAMDKNAVTTGWLESLPLGVAYPLKVALSMCQREPLSTWSESVYELISRKDLVELLRMPMQDTDKTPRSTQLPRQADDVSTVTEICQKIQSPESLASGRTLADDHEAITNLIFRNDRRMLEVTKLLEYSQPGVMFWFRPPPSVTYVLRVAFPDIVNMLPQLLNNLMFKHSPFAP